MQDLILLAKKYETSDFLKDDPSQFMHRAKNPLDQEILGFIAASLSFGQRKQILSHMELIMKQIHESEKTPLDWLKAGSYQNFFTLGDKSFYRMFTHKSMLLMCSTLRSLVEKYGSLGQAFKSIYQREAEESRAGTSTTAARPEEHLSRLIAREFPAECNIIPHTESSANKRINMFLRWMVRDASPVDLGLWTWYPKVKLLMPLDTHVMTQATKLGLLSPSASGKPRAASFNTAVELTQKLKQYFPQDPVRADFALFGLGVDQTGES